MTIYRADILSAQQNFILRRNLQVSFEQEKESVGCKERKSFVNTEMLVFIIEIIGTVAFASSGAMVGIRKKMDVLGVIVMAVMTPVGGGLIRDLVLGIHPPNTFKNPIYVEYSVLTAVILFVVFYIKKQMLDSKALFYYEKIMILLDAIGLGAFTVIGVETAYEIGYVHHRFLLLFVGVITGVGGGMIRDMMAQQIPFILVKQIYACASLAGAGVCIWLMPYHKSASMILGAVVVVIIRILAATYRWDLPKIE